MEKNYRQNASYDEIIEQGNKAAGNTGLPFGLCKKFGIKLSDNATPREAWDVLQKRTGKSPEAIYWLLKKHGEISKEKFDELKAEESRQRRNSQLNEGTYEEVFFTP